MEEKIERDYLLGTHDEEIERLGIQHRVWRPEVLAAWRRAGITAGWKVIDVGSGPGYATVDLAEIVGHRGEVLAVERSTRFLDHARKSCDGLGLTNVRYSEADLMSDSLDARGFDAAWCRWVASFVSDPARLVASIGDSLRLGGLVIFHDYFDYGAWRMSPHRPLHEALVEEIIATWKESGGHPDVCMMLPTLLREAGFAIKSFRPLQFAIRPQDFQWQWPRSFIQSHVPRLVELGHLDVSRAGAIMHEFEFAESDPDTIMLTPTVLEIVAEKVR